MNGHLLANTEQHFSTLAEFKTPDTQTDEEGC